MSLGPQYGHHYPYYNNERMIDERRWQQIIDVHNEIYSLVEQGKEVVYANMSELNDEGRPRLPARFRAMVRHYYLNNGKMNEHFYYEDEDD